MSKLRALLLFLFLSPFIHAQQPAKPNAAEIYDQIKKLNFLGSVLYIAAHPDDENTRLIAYMANAQHARTAYLSLTRGDGGQNLIGPELREGLGVIRTQELLEARKIDGGEQFFSRANDFGYSKTPDETLQIWNKEAVLSDMVYLIRKFQPDVIINRFDARTPGTTHGHHTSSAMLSIEAFDKTNDAKSFPGQLGLVQTWQPKRLFFNTNWWFYGSREKFDKADKSNLYKVPTGFYYAGIGKSNQEIAALSRSRHQSQGFGNTGVRGEDAEYLELLKGDDATDKTNLFEGIDTSWNRVKGGKPIGELLAKVEKQYDFKNPSASIADLARAYTMIQSLGENHWAPIKSEEIKKIIAACAGLYLEAVADNAETTPGNTTKLKIEAINRSAIQMQLTSVKTLETANSIAPTELKNNISNTFDSEIKWPQDARYTQPYWLEEKGTVGMYTVNDQKNIGIPDIIRDQEVIFNITVAGVSIPFERTIIYKYNDDVKGEVYRPFDIVPDVSTAIVDKVTIFDGTKTKTVAVKVKAGKDNVKGDIELDLPADWKVDPKSKPFALAKKGEELTFQFEVTAPSKYAEVTAKSVATVDGKRFDKEQISINYEHISKQQILKPSEAHFLNLDIKIAKKRIAYIMGAGDEVPNSLKQMGFDVIVIRPEDISIDLLKNFDAVMTGIRAYNTIPALAFKQQLLFDFVAQGHTMIVQYNTLDDFVTKDFAPFALKISRDRVTEENAAVQFLEPDHVVLNYPNKITANDFEGWKQEQGLYYPSEWDKAFTPILASHDKGEPDKKGALLVAKYGKGHYIYTGLSFFRELPEGVPGAFRLMANLISIQPEK
jgi:LmbE family N-acetylglucosaminyl deacetylase